MKLKSVNEKTENSLVEVFCNKKFNIEVKYNWLERLILNHYGLKHFTYPYDDNKLLLHFWYKYQNKLNDILFEWFKNK